MPISQFNNWNAPLAKFGYPAGELFVLGWELRFQALCHSSIATVFESI